MLTKWKAKQLSSGRWIAHRATCPAADHFCWRALFGFSPGCRIFDTFEPALNHAVKSAAYDQAMAYMDRRP